MESNSSGASLSPGTPGGSELSEREHEILRLVATGASNKQIAQQLVISPNTVKVHLRNKFAKIGVATRTEATLYAIREGLVQMAPESLPNLGNLPLLGAEPVVGPPAAAESAAGVPANGTRQQPMRLSLAVALRLLLVLSLVVLIS